MASVQRDADLGTMAAGMRYGTGIETIQEIRASAPSVQIAVMSGSQKARLETLKVVARELGVSRFLLKPVDPRVLIDTVKELARLSDEQDDA